VLEGVGGKGSRLPLDESGEIVHSTAMSVGGELLVGHVLALAVTRRGSTRKVSDSLVRVG